MVVRFPVLWIAGIVIGLLFGCERREAGPLTVQAKTSFGFGQWRSRNTGRCTPAEWGEFDAMVQEIRLAVTIDREATGSAAVDEALRRRIDGRSFEAVLALGYGAKRRRLVSLRDELKRAVDGNAWLVTKEGEGTSADYMAGVRARQRQQLETMDAEIDAAEQRLATLTPEISGAEKLTAGPGRDRSVDPTAIPRETARAAVGRMIEERRDSAKLKYGPWPVRIDPDGATLVGADLAAYLKRRDQAQLNGHTVIPVSLRGHWWIYDAPPEMPGLSSAVLANLTPADRREIAREWSFLQAEVWSRGKASREAEATDEAQ